MHYCRWFKQNADGCGIMSGESRGFLGKCYRKYEDCEETLGGKGECWRLIGRRLRIKAKRL